MLTVLTHSGVGEVAAVVTRWFGGTKLGTGGLARAYSAAVQAALEQLPRRERVETVTLTVVVDYAHFAAVRHALPAVEAELLGEDFGAEVTLALRVPVSRLAELRLAIGNAAGGRERYLP
jgi:putative IMPACT (imprinted ancient) family translation regulator